MFKNEVFTSTNFDQRPLFVLTHGFFSPQFPPWISKAKDSLLAQGFNVVLLLWDSMNNKIPDYYGSVADTRIVSDILALFIEALVAEGLVSVDKIVLLGHSLGAHICGMAGKQIFNLRGII
uniref:Lipase domain-containing protein n=1 Tax=Romanomermis culicivorax TaxID=13658 RepID=A0A915I363_ROMCU